MTDEQPPAAPGGADGTWAPPGWTGRPDPTGPAPALDSTTADQRMPDWTVADPGGGPADDPGDRRRRRSRRLLATGVAGVIMIAAITTGVVLGAGGGKSASAAVIDAVDSTMADRTAQMSLAVAVSAGGTTVKEAGNGSIDFSQNAFQLTGSEHAGGQRRPPRPPVPGRHRVRQRPWDQPGAAGKVVAVAGRLVPVRRCGPLRGQRAEQQSGRYPPYPQPERSDSHRAGNVDTGRRRSAGVRHDREPGSLEG